MDDTQTTSPATEHARTQMPAGEDTPSGPPGFGERGRMRRRMRFLRKARELAYRDLGGLVFDLHRFGRRNDTLVLAKLETIGRIDTELRALEATLAERRGVTVLREAGVAACPRCAAIHGSDDRFCPNCGLAMDLRAERPMAGPQASPAPTPPSAPAPSPAPMPTPAPAMASTAAHTPAPAMPAAAPTAPPISPGVAPVPATPPVPSTATSTPAAPAASPAPSRTATPAATPAPRAPNPTATPAPAATPPSTPAPVPEEGATPAPSDPAPASDGDSAATETRPTVEQPTEIVRPPTQNP